MAFSATASGPTKRTNRNNDPDAKARKDSLAAVRRYSIIFFPFVLTSNYLISMYTLMWGKETMMHPALDVIPGDSHPYTGKYPLFRMYFYHGLVPPFSAFSRDLMLTYGFKALDFTTNAMSTLSVFAHLCENFIGVVPT